MVGSAIIQAHRVRTVTTLDMLTNPCPGRKINSSPTNIDDPSVLKTFLTTPPVKKIDLRFPLGIEVTARNLKGVTIKDALDAIYKAYKKRVSNHLATEVGPEAQGVPRVDKGHLWN